MTPSRSSLIIDIVYLQGCRHITQRQYMQGRRPDLGTLYRRMRAFVRTYHEQKRSVVMTALLGFASARVRSSGNGNRSDRRSARSCGPLGSVHLTLC